MSINEDNEFYVSFSECKTEDECSFKHHLIYNEGHKPGDTVHTAFGTSVHEGVDRKFKGSQSSWITMGKEVYRFVRDNPYDKWIKDKDGNQVRLDPKEWTKQSFILFNAVFEWLERQHPGYTVVGSEVELWEDIDGTRVKAKYKGFVDLVIKDKDGKYHLYDFKTSAKKGWDLKKRRDTKRKYQLRLYKSMSAKKLDIPEKDIAIHFLLLKRDHKTPIEVIDVTSGAKAQENANKWLVKMANKIKKGRKLKQKPGPCAFCEFANTELCP